MRDTVACAPAREPAPAVPEYFGPAGFRWMRPGLLGGAGMPGLATDMDLDLEALARVGTRLLVTLTEEWAPEPERFARYGIESLHVPIPDREPPTLGQAHETCVLVAARLARGETVVHHCRAGRGRTGTLIALQLVHEGIDPDAALAAVRSRNRYWVQSEVQAEFLHRFAEDRAV